MTARKGLNAAMSRRSPVESDHVLPCTHLLFVIKNLERIGDHATNIAETIQFLVMGTHMEEKRPKRGGLSAHDLAAVVDRAAHEQKP